jgi:hypothetical protein
LCGVVVIYNYKEIILLTSIAEVVLSGLLFLVFSFWFAAVIASAFFGVPAKQALKDDNEPES